MKVPLGDSISLRNGGVTDAPHNCPMTHPCKELDLELMGVCVCVIGLTSACTYVCMHAIKLLS